MSFNVYSGTNTLVAPDVDQGEQIMSRQRGENGIKQLANGKWQLRITCMDSSGARRTYKRQAETISEARRMKKLVLAELDEGGAEALNSDRLTFEKLSAVYRQRKLFAAKYVNGRKIAGVRSLEPALANLRALNAFFARRRVKAITTSDIEDFKSHRLATPTKNDLLRAERTGEPANSTRSIASANRELEMLRAMLNFAKREGWVTRSPFELGSRLISKADEAKRDRVLSHDEEIRLIAALRTPRRKHLLPFVIAALDTSSRRGELFKLRWSDVDFSQGLIFIRATNTKTQTQRFVGMTDRLASELRKLYELSPDKVNGLVFGLTNTIKTGLKTALAEAGIENFRLHDARHTAITRMVNEGLPSSEIMKATGHTQMTTFQRYVNPTAETIRQNAARLGRYNEARLSESAASPDDFIN